MKTILQIIMFAVAGVGLFANGNAQAQQPASNSGSSENSVVKPCVVVCGAVRSPAHFEIRRRVRVAEVLAMAGGPTERARGTIQLIHSESNCFQGAPGNQTARSGDASDETITLSISDLPPGDERANPFLQAGDLIIVVEAPPVYVTGNVVKPQALLLREPMTLMQAITMAGGVLGGSDTERIRIIRVKSGESAREDIGINLNAIKKHRAEDPVLQPYDIIYVSPSKKSRSIYFFFDSRPLVIQLPSRVVS